MKVIEKSSKEEFVSFFIDLYQLLYLPDIMKVNDRLKEFLVHLVVMYNEGWKLDSPDAVLEVADRMGFRNKGEVYNYRRILKKKNLLVQTKTELMLPVALRFKTIPSKLTFNFSVVNNYETEI